MTYLQYAISIMEENLKTEVFSIRPIDDNEHENLLFLVNFDYVIRINNKHPLDEIFREKHGEYRLYEALSKKALALPIPPFIYYNERRDKVEAFVPGTPFGELPSEPENIKAVVASIAELHNIVIEISPFDPIARFRHYKAGNRSPLPDAFEQEVIRRFQMIYDSRPLVLSHNHLEGQSIIVDEGKATLLDLAFVGMNAPIYDIASFVSENALDTTNARTALLAYSVQTLESPYSIEELETAVSFVDALSYYYNSKMYRLTKQERYKKLAAVKKKRFLFAFESSLMEDKE